MRIDANLLISGESYEPRIGAEYEVAPGVWLAMKPITVKVRRAVEEATGGDTKSETDLLRLILADVPEDLEDDDLCEGLPAKVLQDFFTIQLLILKRLTTSSEESEQETQAVVEKIKQSSPPGLSIGNEPQTDGI